MARETEVDEVRINGVSYIRKDKAVRQPEPKGKLKIVILQRGWVMIGHFERKGNDCQLHNASVIRIWGTTKGLGELAETGPLTNTKLDPANGLVEFDYLTVVAMISCREDVWLGKLQ